MPDRVDVTDAGYADVLLFLRRVCPHPTLHLRTVTARYLMTVIGTTATSLYCTGGTATLANPFRTGFLRITCGACEQTTRRKNDNDEKRTQRMLDRKHIDVCLARYSLNNECTPYIAPPPK